MEKLKKDYLTLLNEEIYLSSLEEVLNKAGEYFEARSVKEERENIKAERLVVGKRMALKVVGL